MRGIRIQRLAQLDKLRGLKWDRVAKGAIPPEPQRPEVAPGATSFQSAAQEEYEKQVKVRDAAIKRLEGKLRALRGQFEVAYGTMDCSAKPGSSGLSHDSYLCRPVDACQVVDVSGGCEKACWTELCARADSSGCERYVRRRESVSKCANYPSMVEWGQACSATISCLAEPKLTSAVAGLEYESAVYLIRVSNDFKTDDAAGKADFQKSASAIEPGDVIEVPVKQWQFEFSDKNPT